MKDEKYLRLAFSVADIFSKDESTKVGAVIVGDGSVRSIGYNGSPRGCKADEDNRKERPEKYFWFSHAELNAITNASRHGTPLLSSTLYCTHTPCMECARGIVQAGIRRVVTKKPEPGFYERWKEHIERTRILFYECDVEYAEL